MSNRFTPQKVVLVTRSLSRSVNTHTHAETNSKLTHLYSAGSDAPLGSALSLVESLTFQKQNA
ncbi:Hypothetical predicted protein, partial [Scomber scombrus]